LLNFALPGVPNTTNLLQFAEITRARRRNSARACPTQGLRYDAASIHLRGEATPIMTVLPS